MTGTATILRADARHLPLADGSVDLIVTSPPYYALRSYTDGGQHYGGQIGAEPTPAEYVGNLVDCTREWMRVLKPGGSIWVNLGDKYAGAGVSGGTSKSTLAGASNGRPRDMREGIFHTGHRVATGAPAKSLIGLPWRYALRCIDDLGLILRRDQIWSKPNGLPESVTDRTRSSHEYWFHLVKQPRYFAAVDEIRQPHQDTSAHAMSRRQRTDARLDMAGAGRTSAANPLGALPGSVWEIPTEPLTVPDHLGVDHFAAFPTEWPRRIILGWSPSGICTACGEGRRPVTERKTANTTPGNVPTRRVPGEGRDPFTRHGGPGSSLRLTHSAELVGEACACPDTSAPTRPAVVLDPFSGTGTTTLVAKSLGRHGIGSDRSADYCRLATWRTTDPGELAKAMRVPKPPVQADGQGDLFADLLGGDAA